MTARITNQQREVIVRKAIAERDAILSGAVVPIDMVLHCPRCHEQHIDKDLGAGMLAEDVASYGEPWRNPPHKSHLCAFCGCQWRPADVPTNGVQAVKTRGQKDNWP